MWSLKNIFWIIAIAAIGFGAYSCKKIDQDPEYPFTIIVKTMDDSTRIQNTFIEVYVPQTIGNVKFSGYTNEAGEVHFTYDKDAVFQVRATRGENPYTHIGCTYVRLEANEEVYQTVYIQPYNPEYEGCFL